MKPKALALLLVTMTGCATTSPKSVEAPQASTTPEGEGTSPTARANREDVTEPAAKEPASNLAKAAPTGNGSVAPPKDELDPLALDGVAEAATVPTVTRTPARELRKKTHADLDFAMKLAKKADTADQAAESITRRIGKPTWTEADGQRRVWVAEEGTKCHRLILDADGDLELEEGPAGEWKTISAFAQQQFCTGEIRKGL